MDNPNATFNKLPVAYDPEVLHTSKQADAPQEEQKRSSEKYEWTIMVYLAGDNNLSSEMVWALKELYRIGAPAKTAITVQFDPFAEGSGTRFYYLTGECQTLDVDGAFQVLHDEELDEADSGDPDVLSRFVLQSIRLAPAKYYMLILSGHGSGVIGDFLVDNDARKKDLQPRSLTIPALGKAFRTVREHLRKKHFETSSTVIDVLGLDSCVMSMAEICSEVRGEVDYLIASEGFVADAGWPYYRLLHYLWKDMTSGQVQDPRGCVRALVHRYTNYYSDYSAAEISVDMSACGLGGNNVETLEEKVREFVEFVRGRMRDPEDRVIHNLLLLAHWKAQSYKWEQYTDLVDFVDELSKECESFINHSSSDKQKKMYGELLTQCEDIQKVVEKVVLDTDFSGPDFQHSHGLSVYFPWSRCSYAEEYRQTAFAQRTGWGDFLEDYFRGTQRKPRHRLEAIKNVVDTKNFTVPEVGTGTAVLTEEGNITLVLSDNGTDRQIDRVVDLAPFPFGKVTPPFGRVTPPFGRVTPPFGRVTPPFGRVTPPFGRIDWLLAPSTIKNSATDWQPSWSFNAKDWESIQKFIEQKYQKQPPLPVFWQVVTEVVRELVKENEKASPA